MAVEFNQRRSSIRRLLDLVREGLVSQGKVEFGSNLELRRFDYVQILNLKSCSARSKRNLCVPKCRLLRMPIAQPRWEEVAAQTAPNVTRHSNLNSHHEYSFRRCEKLSAH